MEGISKLSQVNIKHKGGNLKIMNEWELSAIHRKALLCQDFEVCAEIKKEVDKRIESDTLKHEFMQGFRYYNPISQQFEGEYEVGKLNGLFDKYIEKYPPKK